MADEIKFSPNTDVAPIDIKDVAPERMIRVYPYEMPRASKSEEFMGQQTTSIVYITQDNLGIDNEGVTDETISIDENGFKYFEMMAAITSVGKLDLSSSTSTLGQELKEEDNFISLSNWYYEGELEDIKLGAMRFVPAMFTIGRPYDDTAYRDGSQTVYLASSMVEAKEGRAQYVSDIDSQGLYEFSMINVAALESSFTNASLIFNQDANNLQNPTITTGTSFKPGFEIEPDQRMLISSIKAKGKTVYDDRLTDIDLIALDGLIPLKATPVSTQDKVSLFMDWFDYDVVLPQYIGRVFLNKDGVKLSTLKNVDFENNGVTVKFFDDNQLALIQDVILVSSLFAENFSREEWRYTATEAKDSGGGAKAGDIKGDITVGTKKMSMASIAGKDPIKVVDGIFETYLRDFPEAEDSTQYLAIKEIFAAASRYIYSSYSIGKGQNSFNQIYLPWYLRPASQIEIGGSEKQLLLSDETKWKLESKWFDFSNYDYDVATETPISRVKLIKTDRKLTMPELPYTVDSISKLPLPGDINTKSSQDLKYMWYLPVSSSDAISKLYLGQPKSTTDKNPTVTFSTSWTKYGEAIKGVPDYIVKDYSDNNGLSTSQIHYVSEGTLESRTNRENSVHPSMDIYRSWAGYTKGQQWSPYMNIGGNVTEDELKEYLANKIAEYLRGHGKPWMEDSAIKIVDGVGFKKISSGNSVFVGYTGSFGIEFTSTRYVDAQVMLDKPAVSYDINREVLFDKSRWMWYLKDHAFTKIPEIKLIEPNGLQIETIDEIIISSIWGSKITVTINGSHHEVDLFNEDDETIATQRIVFS